MSISMSNFDTAVKTGISADRVSAILTEARQERSYTLEQLAVTTGLTVDELKAVEDGGVTDPALVQRIASALGLPPAALL
ncbi:helix-turn-helix domain-containing protein [Pseudorhizobium flavum]|jgi:transcriptional regulator with XRE-family HTH domain|uniref:Transcriptional regulator with XRE-family HTH domain n=1 Tax=Pseudorhizobium flavum TaxID=1335061 RepID=A0A7X0DCS3_9HYPH|nr:helix-turn-helix domain-containing protein [Pseudorhizobium flavum]MBB6179945.1 transcriptional regulator with XRE-family HTH domain [Pseudorhizobium flavum]CAD6598247.1 transcriptional regulator [Pseudorhizobium flavum]